MQNNTIRSLSRQTMLVAFLLVSGCAAKREPSPLYVIDVQSPQELKDFFHYTEDKIPFISSHRGGPVAGYPENCLATFENTLRHTWSVMEVDPRYTKDSAIVLMHDPTLERTSTGKGKVSDYTLEELKKLRLKDNEGSITGYQIPTLDEALEWAKGKTVLVLDQKDVPIAERVKKIKAHQAEANAIVIAYSYEDARQCYEMDKNIMMEVFIPDKEAALKFESTGVPWQNVVAFITHYQPKDSSIYRYLHEKGVMCIRGSSRTIEKAYLEGKINDRELKAGYRKIIQSGADIIEADMGITAGRALQGVHPVEDSKEDYFSTR